MRAVLSLTTPGDPTRTVPAVAATCDPGRSPGDSVRSLGDNSRLTKKLVIVSSDLSHKAERLAVLLWSCFRWDDGSSRGTAAARLRAKANAIVECFPSSGLSKLNDVQALLRGGMPGMAPWWHACYLFIYTQTS